VKGNNFTNWNYCLLKGNRSDKNSIFLDKKSAIDMTVMRS